MSRLIEPRRARDQRGTKGYLGPLADSYAATNKPPGHHLSEEDASTRHRIARAWRATWGPVPGGSPQRHLLPLIFRKIPLKFRFQEGAAMTTRKPRNFDCPNGGLCVDGRCTRDRCVRGEEATAQRDHERAADHIILAFSIRWD